MPTALAHPTNVARVVTGENIAPAGLRRQRFEPMTTRQGRSFAEVTFLEAVARRIHLYLIVKPATPKTDGRLRSRFLGIEEPGRLILDVPQGGNRKVYVPVGQNIGMAFPMGHFLLQARTTVLDHCQFQLYPTRRIDSLVVQRPGRIISVNRRSQPRFEVDPSEYIMASFWPADSLTHRDQTAIRSGQLANWSVDGLGIRLAAKLPFPPGTRMIIRLEEAGSDEWPIFQAVLMHCSPQADERWLAGFGQVVRVEPGQAVGMIEALVARPGRSNPGTGQA